METIRTKYGDIQSRNYQKYFELLVGKTYKILPMYEENSPTLRNYLESYDRELIGNTDLLDILKNEPQFITLLNTIQYLIDETYSIDVCKKEVFKCIHILKSINNKYFVKEE